MVVCGGKDAESFVIVIFQTPGCRQSLMVYIWGSGEKSEIVVEVICIEVDNYTE